MHPVTLPEEIRERLLARRGRLHVYDRLDPARTALVIVDMQNLFCAEGALIEVPVAREIVPAINRIAGAMRALGGTVAWVRTAFPESDRDWVVFFETFHSGPLGARIRARLQHGTAEYDYAPGLRPEENDIEVDKDRYSAFIPGASPLHDQLRARGIDTLLVAGTLTNVCCETTARDAMMLNYRVVLLSDANAARSDEEHMGALITVAQSFGDVQTVEEAIGFLEAGRTTAP